MPVYIHLANLFIDKDAIVKKYEGGIEQFRSDYSIGGENYNQEDNEIIAIAKMNLDEFDLNKLLTKGLHYDKNLQFSTDFTLRSRYGTYLWNTEWISDNDVFAWHKKANSELIAKAIAIGNLTIQRIEELAKQGEDPFATIV
jgi:hypothetical protein